VIISFTGTQHGLTSLQANALHWYLSWSTGPFVFVHGDCIGADAQAHDIAAALGWTIQIYPSTVVSKRAFKLAPHNMHPMAPLARNTLIAKAGDMLIACPSGPEILRSGTWSTVRRARKAGKPITVIWPDGSCTKEPT
jgi:hypothetical protein